MKKKTIIAIILIAITAGGIYQYIRINTYSYHLNKAKIALTRIEELSEGESSTSKSIAPIAYAQAGQIDEDAIARNADIAVDEIGAAQNIVNDMTDGAEQTGAQNEIDETKGQAEETFNTASEAVEGEDAKESISDAQESLDKIEAGKDYYSDDTARDESNDDSDDDMQADTTNNDEYFDDDEEDDEEDDESNEEEKNIDEANIDKQEDDESNDDDGYDAAYKAAEEEAMKRYQPYLDWKGDTPVPLEGQQGGDTANTDNGTAPDAEAMQDAIDKLRTEGEEGDTTGEEEEERE